MVISRPSQLRTMRVWRKSLLLGAVAAVSIAALGIRPAWSATPSDSAKSNNAKHDASVSGTVLNSITGEPIKRATLVLMPAQPGGSMNGTESGDDGTFAISGIQPGRYMLFAQKNGFARQAYGSRGNAALGSVIALTANQELSELAFKVEPAAVISGKVADHDGEPVANATVMAVKATYQRGVRQILPLAASQTDDLGHFRLSGLKAGKFYVLATYRSATAGIFPSAKPPQPEGEPGYTTTYYPGVQEFSEAAPVMVSTGSDAVGTNILMDRVTTFHISGSLQPIPGGKSVLVWLTKRSSGPAGPVTSPYAIMRPDGSFDIGGAAPGSYLLHATLPDGITPVSSVRPVDVEDKHLLNVVLSGSKVGELRGTVKLDGKDDKFPEGLRLQIQPNELNGNPPLTAAIGKDGRFVLDDVPAARYEIVLDAPNDTYIESIRYGGADLSDNELDASSGCCNGPLAVSLQTTGARVDGVVRDRDSQPVAGAIVGLVPEDTHAYSRFRQAVTDQNGSFKITALPIGDYRLFAWDDIEPNAFEDPEVLRRFEGSGTKVSLRERDQKHLVIQSIAGE